MALAALAYGVAAGLDGSGFIAAFVAGGVFGGVLGRDPDEVNRLVDELGGVLSRGLASIVFALIVLEESALPNEGLILTAIYLTVGLSVLAHGLTAAPLAGRYAAWYESHPRRARPPMESAPSVLTRLRSWPLG